jgi:hypothetical protein
LIAKVVLADDLFVVLQLTKRDCVR